MLLPRIFGGCSIDVPTSKSPQSSSALKIEYGHAITGQSRHDLLSKKGRVQGAFIRSQPRSFCFLSFLFPPPSLFPLPACIFGPQIQSWGANLCSGRLFRLWLILHLSTRSDITNSAGPCIELESDWGEKNGCLSGGSAVSHTFPMCVSSMRPAEPSLGHA